MSTINLRSYQIKLIEEIYEAWDAGYQNVGLQLMTGGGKTVIFSEIVSQHAGYTMIVVHRDQILSQISLMLAEHNISHDIIASQETIKMIINAQLIAHGKSYFKSQHHIMIASVDTLKKRTDHRFNHVTLLIQDEAHHALKSNKWGKVAEFFPRAKGLYPTATPCRADGKGLGRHADGIIDILICGPSGRRLIKDGHLCDYIVYAPNSDLDLSQVPLSVGGDYSPGKLETAIKKSHIVGDIVTHYLRHASGKLGLTFTTSIANAGEIAQAYREAGVRAEVISGKTPPPVRASLIRQFKNREILQLVSVDIFGEGVDIPAIEVLSLGRPTESLAVYHQQFGRALRLLAGKKRAIIIDHVGNIKRHGRLPDAQHTWTLERRSRKQTEKGICLIKICGNERCAAVYSRTLKICPHCGYYTEPTSRSEPEFVDGDLIELAPETLAKLRGEITRIDDNCYVPQYLDSIAQMAIMKRHRERKEAQQLLRQQIAQWAGFEKDNSKEDSEIYRSFYIKFGIDILTAQTLNKVKADELSELIKKDLTTLLKEL